ncbi:L-xylulose reductase-like [Argiope bruennichi]|uniref:L-xylulose reductase-like n=1 Tax=Argiope bruennichi TaxID=94029 RepID=UPI0024943D72|nr:L-xylulose reductase-like [Argiope bruennichi]
MEILFHGKRALVTGAGKGIGRALALKLADCGAEVVAVSRTQSDLDALKKESPKIQPLCLDIGNWEVTKNALKSVGPIDLLVNNAGIMEPKEYGTYTEQDCDKTFNINVKAIVNIGQMIANDMKTRGTGGSIVNVSSVMGFTVAPSYGVYCASKGAVDQLTRSMAVEFGPYNIRVNSINPTVVRTRMAEKEGLLDKDNEFAQNMIKRTPLRRFADPGDVVNPILFLLSDKAAMITGITVPVDGGLAVNYV